MKKYLIGMLLFVAVAMIGLPALAEINQPRDPVIRFQAALADDNDLNYDGQIDVVVSYYDSASGGATLLYRETFADVNVERGNFRLPLLTGADTSGNVDDVVTHGGNERYVDLSVDGVLLLVRHPLGRYLGAIRSEKADYAYGLKENLILTNSDIPDHDANKVTSGLLAEDIISTVQVNKFSAGTFGMDQVPQFSADHITGGVFSADVMPPTLAANLFTAGTLSDDVIPDDILTTDDIHVSTGTVGHLGVIPIPMGYSIDYCQWVVGMKALDGEGGLDQFRVYADADGVVTCRWSPKQADEELNHYCVASYMLVCIK